MRKDQIQKPKSALALVVKKTFWTTPKVNQRLFVEQCIP